MIANKKAAPVRQHRNGQDNSAKAFGLASPRCHNNDNTRIDRSQHQHPPRHGIVRGHVWRKKVYTSKHMLRKPPAWAVDVTDLERAEALGATWLELREQDHGEVYSVKLATLRERGRRIDRGFGPQIMLILGYWQCLEAKETDPNAPKQTGFWGGERE